MFPVSEKTPDESDDYSTSHENREVSHIPDRFYPGNDTPILTVSDSFIPSGHSRYSLVSGGVGHFPDRKMRMLRNVDILFFLRIIPVLTWF